MGYGGFPVPRERPARQNPTDGYAGIRGDLCLGTGSPENATAQQRPPEQQSYRAKKITKQTQFLITDIDPAA